MMPNRMLYQSVKRAPAPVRTAPGPAAPQQDPFARLERQLTGRLLRPGEDGYPAARRVFNRAVQTRPAAIACCANEADIRDCLAFARTTGTPFRIRGGGHGLAGNSVCDGLVIDVSLLDDITLDGVEPLATVGGGCAQGQLGRTLAAAGLHVPLGDWPDVGIGGFMQGGGYGTTARSFGMNADHVEAVRMMLAGGEVVAADRQTNRDLWWAVRGGAGGSFGVLLSMRYRLQREIRTSVRSLVWPLATAGQRVAASLVLTKLQSGFTRDGPPDTNITAMAAYGLDRADRSMRGPWLIISAEHVGSPQAMKAALAPLLAMPGRLPDFDFARLKRGSDIPALRRQSRYVAKGLGARDWEAMLDLLAAAPSDITTLYLQTMGGALNAVPRESSAFVHRDADLLLYMDVFWREPEARATQEAFQDRWTALLEPFWNGRCYQNFPDPALADYRAAYWGDAFAALLAVKRKYDPHALFRFPQAVSPYPGRSDPPVVWPPDVAEAVRRPISRLAKPT